MKRKLLLFIVLFNTINLLAKNKIGGQIAVHLYIDVNCNKMADKGEYVSSGFTANLSGSNYNKSLKASSNEALFTSLSFGSYTASVSYPYTYPNGVSTTLSGSGSVTISSPSVEVIDVLLNPCNQPTPVSSCGKWTNAKITTSSAFDISGNTALNNSSSLTVNKYNTVLSFNGSYSGIVNDVNKNCTINGTIIYPDKTVVEWNNNFTITANKKGTYVVNYAVACGSKDCETGSKQIINNTEEEKELPKDLCGQWQNNTIFATLNNKTVGEYTISSRNSFEVALLNTELKFDGSYKWAFEKRTGNCKITGTIIEPDGNKINWTNDFKYKVRKPGTFSITYQIKCTESICEAGVKVFTCNDVIVCNCAPQQNNYISFRNLGAKGSFKNINNGDSILIDKAFRPTFNYDVQCQGNICDATTTYTLYNMQGTIVNTDANGFFNPRRENGLYTLEVKGYCGGKNCSTLRFPVRIYGQNKAEYTRSRWGNQIGVNFGWPKFNNLNRDKMYVGAMFGFIADMPFGYYKRWHFWPAINIATAKFIGTQQLTGATVNVVNKQLQLRVGADLSYAFPVGKKDAKLHIYAGVNFSGAVCNKTTYTANPTTALAPWIVSNKSDSTQKISANFNAGLLYDINKTFTLGLNYYQYNVVAHKKLYTPLTDRGISLRLAWFYHQYKNGERSGK